MSHSSLLLAIGLLASMGCAASDESPASAGEATNEDDVQATRKVEVAVTWSCGEGEEPDREPNEDGEHSVTETIVLGPLASCLEPPASRPASAKCAWSAPSTCWNIGLAIVAGAGGAPVMRVHGSAGDADSTFGGRLPVSNVPRSADAWETETSPDNASGSWGSARVAVRRLN